MELKGVIPPLVTPVKSRDGEIDVDSVKSLTDFLVDKRVHGLFATGTVGEFANHTRSQRRSLIQAIGEMRIDGPFLVGCGGTAIGQVQRNIGDATDAGADVAVVPAPYYYDTTQEALCEFFELVADDADIPILLYHIPQRTGVDVSPESVATLASHDNILGLKDTSRDFTYFASVNERTPDSFQLLMASPELSVASLDLGADGLVSAPYNVAPRAAVELFEKHTMGDRERSIEILQNTMLPLIRITRSMPSIGAMKYLLELRGHSVGKPVLPLPTLSPTEKRRLEDFHQTFVAEETAST